VVRKRQWAVRKRVVEGLKKSLSHVAQQFQQL
jgi:hypothetical protein